MKFRVERDVLAEAVAWVVRGLNSRPPVPVLAGVLLEAQSDGTVTLSAFDYEISARVTIEAEVDEPGTVLVLGRLLSDISRNLPPRTVELATDGTKVQVTCGSSRFALLQMPVDDYPTLPQSPEVSGTVDGHVLTQAVAQVSVAADRGDTLPILTGVRVEIDGEKILMYATDRYRLAMRELTWNPHSPSVQAQLLVPGRTLSDVARSLAAVGGVDVSFGNEATPSTLMAMSSGSRETTLRLLDGEYPKVKALFPSSVDTSAVIETAQLIEAVKRVAIVAERNTPIRLRFNDGSLIIEAGAGDDAQASEAIECQLTGPEVEIAFNAGFLLDGLSSLGTQFTRVALTQPSRPAVISGQAEADAQPDDTYRYLIMPVRFAS